MCITIIITDLYGDGEEENTEKSKGEKRSHFFPLCPAETSYAQGKGKHPADRATGRSAGTEGQARCYHSHGWTWQPSLTSWERQQQSSDSGRRLGMWASTDAHCEGHTGDLGGNSMGKIIPQHQAAAHFAALQLIQTLGVKGTVCWAPSSRLRPTCSGTQMVAVLLLVIHAAREHILVTNPSSIPSLLLLYSLCWASNRAILGGSR